MDRIRLERDWRFKTTRSSGSTPIRFATYSKTENPERILLFLNGRTEWIEKYDFLPESLGLPENTMFVTMDHRGQGASGGLRADIDSYDYYVEDVQRVLSKLNLDVPVSIVGHSMGGLIALYGCMKNKLSPERLLLSAPLLGFPQRVMNARVFKMALKRFRNTQLGAIPHKLTPDRAMPFENNPYTHDPENFRLINNCPYRVPPATFKWLFASLDAIDTVFNGHCIENLKAHTLILMGTDERIIDTDAIPRWIKEVTNQTSFDICSRRIEGARHELFFESEQYLEQVVASTKEWFKEIWQS